MSWVALGWLAWSDIGLLLAISPAAWSQFTRRRNGSPLLENGTTIADLDATAK